MHQQKTVLLALGWYDHRLLIGIASYAATHHWHLSTNLIHEQVIPWGWRGDGVLAWLGAGDELAEFVVSVKKPTVDFSLRRPELQFPRVLQDHANSAAMVAEHFLSRGLKNFLFYSDTDNWSNEERGLGFVSALRVVGRDCTWIKWHESNPGKKGRNEWSHRRSWLASELRKAPKPLAVFAANDQLAVDVLEVCEQTGIVVPDQVAIVGSEDSLLSVETMRTPITGVDTNLEEQGRQGAALLDSLMRGEPAPRKPIRIPAIRVVTRKSSDIMSVNHPQVAKGLRFIWNHFREPIDVDAVAFHAGMSRRGLHQAFLEHIGRTPGQAIRSARIDLAKKLLSETTDKIETIAELCGYGSMNNFFIAFKTSVHVSPAVFRERVHRNR